MNLASRRTRDATHIRTARAEALGYSLMDDAKILVCGVNWLGDSIMSMPAVDALKDRFPASRITMLVKSGLAPLWRMSPSINEVVDFRDSVFGVASVARALAAQEFDRAFIFPNSFRSALIPRLAHIPERIGMRGHFRARMLTLVIEPPADTSRAHQAWEYLNIVGLADGRDEVNLPRLHTPKHILDECRARLERYSGADWVGLVPGSARGPSKRWPAEYFVKVGRRLAALNGCAIAVFGSREDVPVCAETAAGIGERVLDLGGRTSLPELLALLGMCRVVIANDSGGMHLAAAAGTRVVAIFGMTDPALTGPLGPGHRVISRAGVSHSRDIGRNLPQARESLKSIEPDLVYSAAFEILEESKKFSQLE